MLTPEDPAVSHFIDVTTVQMPLAAGLRAAAEECNSRLAAQLTGLAGRLERGESLEAVLAEGALGSSRFATAALGQGMTSAEASSVLCELAAWGNQRRTLTRKMGASLAYPLALLVLSLLVLVLLRCYFLPLTQELSVDNEFLKSGSWNTLEAMDRAVIMTGTGIGLVLGWLAITRFLFGRARWRWYLTTLPVVGTLLQWQGAWEFSAKLRMLIVRGVPLADSLDILAVELSDPNYADVSHRLAMGQRGGKSLSQQMCGTTRLPETLVMSIAWGESRDRLPDALAMASDVFFERLKIYLDFLASTLPAIVLMGVAGLAVNAAISLAGPMIDNIRMLGGGLF